jgi:hypothetical protein
MGACWKMVVVHGGKEEDGSSSWGKEEDGGSSWGEKR